MVIKKQKTLGHLVDTWSLFYHKTGCLHGFTVCFFYNTECLPTKYVAYYYKRWGKLMLNLTQKKTKKKKRTAPGSRGGTGAAGARRTGRSGAGGGAGRGGTAAGARHLKKKPPVDQFWPFWWNKTLQKLGSWRCCLADFETKLEDVSPRSWP